MKRSFALFFLGAVICPIAPGSERRLKSIGVDEQTGTHFSIIDKSGGMPGTDPCTGGYGNLEVFGEVPPTVSLEDGGGARLLGERAKAAALKACPRFAIPGGLGLSLWLIKGTYNATAPYTDPTYRDYSEKLVRAPWEVYLHWKQFYPREPMKQEYFNAAAARAALAKEVVRPISEDDFLFLLGTDTKTGTKFWVYSKLRAQKCWSWSGGQMDIVGEVPGSISLLDESATHSLFAAGAQMLLDKCGDKPNLAKIFLAPTDAKLSTSSSHIEPVRAEGQVWRSQWPMVTNIANYVVQAEQQKIQKARAEKEQMEVRGRYDRFVKTNGVKQWPTIQELMTNPFVYEGTTVAIEATFEEMATATQGVFACRVGGTDHFLVVSGIAKATFTKRAPVVLAGRVLGKTEVKGGFGSLAVPHLNFAAVHFCADWGCRDIIPK